MVKDQQPSVPDEPEVAAPDAEAAGAGDPAEAEAPAAQTPDEPAAAEPVDPPAQDASPPPVAEPYPPQYAPTSPQPVQYALAQPYPGQPQPVQYAPYPTAASPAPPVAGIDPARPFAGVPVWDYVRDGVAALLLLFSLSLRWDFYRDATDRIDVVLITILSVFSLAVPYMARLGALGHGWTASRFALVRLLANAPYLVMVLIYVVLDILGGGDTGVEGGLGVAIGLGLAGALLAAQPREAELTPGRGGLGQVWYGVVVGLGAAAALGGVASLLATLVRMGDFLTGRDVILAILALATIGVLVIWPAVGTALRSGAWRLVLVALGGAAALLLVIADGGQLEQAPVESVHYAVFGYVLWAALGAAAAAPSVRRAMDAEAPSSLWTGAAVRLLTLAVVACGIEAIQVIVRLTDGSQYAQFAYPRGTLVFALVFAIVYAAGAVVLRSALVQGQPNVRYVAYGVSGGLLVLGIVNLAVIGAEDLVAASYLDLVLAFAVPIAVAVWVSVPGWQEALARRPRPAVAGAPGAQPWQGAPATPAAPVVAPAQAGATPPPPPPPPAQPVAAPTVEVPESVRLASDPATPAEKLAELAASSPEAWVAIARHPNAYPALLGWLEGVGDPAVDQALRERRG